MRGRKRFRRRPRHVGLIPSREDKLMTGGHTHGTCGAGCGVANHQKRRLLDRRRVWYRWVGKPGDLYASCDRTHPEAVAPMKRMRR